MPKFEPFAWGSLIAVLVCLNGGVARAADDADREARERYESAVKLYEEGAYDAALVELNRASELRPSFKIYYNIGQVRFAMHDYAAAIDAYRHYLDQGGDKIPPTRREQVEKELTALNQRVAKLTIETDVSGAEVFIDDVSAGFTPLHAPVIVNSGIRRISARHPDYLPQSRKLSIAGGVQDTIKFALTNRNAATADPGGAAAIAAGGGSARTSTAPPNGSVAPATNPTDRGLSANPEQRTAPTHAIPWAAWAVTGAFAAGATVTGVLALSANSKLEDDRGQLDVSSSDVDSQAHKVRTLATVTDCLIAAAVVSGGVSLWLTLRNPSEPEAAAEPKKAGVKSLQVGFGPSGLSMKGAF
jgi:hypothetical protein